MNNSTSSLVPQSSTVYFYQTTGYGTVVILLNLAIIAILLKRKSLLKKSAFIFGLAVADFMEGLGLVVGGISKILRTLDGSILQQVHPSACMKETIVVVLFGIQLPGVMLFMIGIERFIAIHYFKWYYKKWTNKTSWLAALFGYLFCIVSILVSVLLANLKPDKSRTTLFCIGLSVVGPEYMFFNFFVSIFGGLIAALMTFVALVEYKMKSVQFLNALGNMKAHMQRQLRITRLMFIVAFLDFCLVVVPNVVTMLVAVFNVTFESLPAVSSWTFLMICVRSSMNLFLYLFINTEFRAVALSFTTKITASSIISAQNVT